MFHRPSARRAAVAVCGAAALLAVTLPSASAGAPGADGLFSPLGFAFDDDGQLFVAEAFAGKLTRIDTQGVKTTLFSGDEGTGTAGVDVNPWGRPVFTQSLPPELTDGPPADTTLNKVRRNGQVQRLASLLDFETANNPDSTNAYGIKDASKECLYQAESAADVIGPAVFNGVVESNPYAVAVDRLGRSIVADAAGNTIVRVSRGGDVVKTVAVLPPIPQKLTAEVLAQLPPDVDLSSCVGETYYSNPVPTDVEIGPGGKYLVSTLPGFPELPGAAKVFKIDPATGAISTRAKGLTGAVDLAVGPDRTVYVAELFAGQVSKIPQGSRTATASTAVDCPTAVELDPSGELYAAEGGICSDGPPSPTGRIIKVVL